MLKNISQNVFFQVLILVLVSITPVFAAGGGTLTIANVADAVTLDPAHITSVPSSFVAGMIYDNLVKYDQDGKIKPGLATSWEQSKDGLTWTFHLKKGVKFHDGTPFNAQAVKFNFDRVKDPTTASPGAEDISVVKSVEVVNDYTVKFNLKHPLAAFLYKILMQGEVRIISPEAIKKWGKDIAFHPVGTGPFVFKEWVPGTRIVVVNNKYYWNGAAKLDKIVIRPIPEASTQRVELEAGTVDMVLKVERQDLKYFQDNSKIYVYKVPGYNARYLFLNLMHKPLDNLPVRKAIAYAVNRKEIITALLNGVAEELKGPLPPTMWAAVDNLPEYKYDLQKAKDLLAEAGWKDNNGDGFVDKNGQNLHLNIYSSDGRYLMDKEIAGVMKKQLARIGIDSSVELFEWGAYLSNVDAGKHDICILGWSNNDSEPSNFLDPQFLSHKAGGWANDMFYHRDYIDKLLKKGERVSDIDKRKEIYANFQKLVMKDSPLVPLYTAYEIVATRVRVKGYHHNPSFYDFTSVYIEK